MMGRAVPPRSGICCALSAITRILKGASRSFTPISATRRSAEPLPGEVRKPRLATGVPIITAPIGMRKTKSPAEAGLACAVRQSPWLTAPCWRPSPPFRASCGQHTCRRAPFDRPHGQCSSGGRLRGARGCRLCVDHRQVIEKLSLQISDVAPDRRAAVHRIANGAAAKAARVWAKPTVTFRCWLCRRGGDFESPKINQLLAIR